MTRDEAITEACAIVALAYRSIGDYSTASDGFCPRCRQGREGWTYENDGRILAYVRHAVLDALKRDGHKIAKGFDPVTGKETEESVRAWEGRG